MFTKPSDIAREIRKPGAVYIGMLTENDVVHIAAQKSDLLGWLAGYAGQDECPVYAEYLTGSLHINAKG